MEIKINCEAKENIPLDKFKALQGNLKELSKENYEKLKKSILKYGFSFPVFAWKENGTHWIIDAHQRIPTLKKLRDEENYIIPDLPTAYIFADNKKEAKEKLLQLNSNYGKITNEGLYEFLNEPGFEINFNDIKFDIDLSNIDLEKFEFNFYKETDSEKLDDVPEVPKEAISKTGDLFEIDGKHRVMCGDSTKADDAGKLMNGNSGEILFTSPPYLEMRKYNNNKDLSLQKLIKFINIFSPFTNYQVINLGLKRENNELIEYWESYKKEAKKCGYKLLSWNVWDKSDYGCGSVANATAMFNIVHEWIFVFGRNKKILNTTVKNKLAGVKKKGTSRTGPNDSMIKYKTTVKDFSRLKSIYKNITAFAESVIYKHPAMFPSSFPIEYIKAMTQNNDIVIDCFIGSGSTLIACQQTNRICYGMEIDPLYIDVILKRYKKLYPDSTFKCLNRKFDFEKLFAI